MIGGAGFLGSHLVDHLIEDRDCEVLVLDNLFSGHKKFVNPKATFMWYDIRDDENQLRKTLQEHKVQYLFNYAAEPYIPDSFKRPLHTFNINAFAALKVLHAAHESGVRGILQVSSAEIYGNVGGKIAEDAPIEPRSSYGVSKVAADGFVQVRWKESGVPAIALRQFNCIGARETHPYVVPEIISQISRGNTINLGSNSERDFLAAGDAVRIAVSLLERGQFGEVYNLGSEESIRIYDLADTIAGLMGTKITIRTDSTRVRPWEIWHLQANCDKIYSTIPERPRFSLEEGLKVAIKYFHENGEKWDYE